MTPFEVPLSATPQKVSVTLGVDTYVMTVRWNKAAQCWVFDLADQEGTDVLTGVPIVTGANLLEQFDYLEFGGALIAQSDSDIDAVPTFTNLGTEGHLYFVVL